MRKACVAGHCTCVHLSSANMSLQDQPELGCALNPAQRTSLPLPPPPLLLLLLLLVPVPVPLLLRLRDVPLLTTHLLLHPAFERQVLFILGPHEAQLLLGVFVGLGCAHCVHAILGARFLHGKVELIWVALLSFALQRLWGQAQEGVWFSELWA
jgi:hypothetical protein